MSKVRVYIAGPMTGLPDYNYAAFDKAEVALRSAGVTDIFNPASIGRTHGLDKPYDFYLREAIRNLLTCDAILMLPNWAKSRGAALEYTIATALRYTEIRLADIPSGQQPTTNGSKAPMTTGTTSHEPTSQQVTITARTPARKSFSL